MFKTYNRADKRLLLFTALLFAAFVLLSYLFPYSGDDWAWGSEIGAERLQNWFEDYNGRYAGNLLVMALTRSKCLCAALMAACFTAACLLPAAFAGTADVLSVTLAAVLFLFMPKEIFVQSAVWTSGFANYVPPALLALLYFVSVKNIFGREKPQYGPLVAVLSAAVGFAGGLFMENVTLFNIAAASVVIVFSYVRFKSLFAAHIAYLIGAVSGAVLMFTNSAYGLIARQGDFYRSFFYERGFVDTVTENIKEAFERLFASNAFTLTLLSVMCAALCIISLKGEAGKRRRIVLFSVYVNLSCLAVIYCKSRLDDSELFFSSRAYAAAATLIFLAVGGLYFVSTAVIIHLCVKSKAVREKALFLLFSVFGVVAPLMLVNPIGPRCFFSRYLFISCLCLTLFAYLRQWHGMTQQLQKGISRLAAALCCAMLCFLTAVYGIIHAYDATRNEYVKKQAEQGFKTVVTYYLPFGGYVWNGNPDSVPWDESYKKFHGLDEDVKFRFVLWESFEAFKDNFEKKE